MRFSWQSPRWNDPYAIFGLYFAPLVTLALALLPWLPPERLPVCGLKTLTGIPCPTCGAWRAASALSNGMPAAAWRCQPLLASGYFLLLGIGLYALVTLVCGWKRMYPVLSRFEKALAWVILMVLLAAHWLYLVVDGR